MTLKRGRLRQFESALEVVHTQGPVTSSGELGAHGLPLNLELLKAVHFPKSPIMSGSGRGAAVLAMFSVRVFTA